MKVLFSRLALVGILCLQTFSYLNAYEYEAVYENADDGSVERWKVFDDTPSGATITNLYDSQRQSNVIELKGNGFDNSYQLLRDGRNWGNMNQHTLEFSIKAMSKLRVFVGVSTKFGDRFLYYDSGNHNYSIYNNGFYTYIQHGLGTDFEDGNWHSYRRDLLSDLRDVEPDNAIFAINWLVVRGDARVDDIKLIDNFTITVPNAPSNLSAKSIDSKTVVLNWKDNSNNENGFKIYRDGVLLVTVNANKTTYTDKNLQSSTDYTYEIISFNSAGESESSETTVTTQHEGLVSRLIEDAEDGNTKSWSIYDGSDTTTISNVFDAERGSNVIKLSGDGFENAYMLKKEDGSFWDEKEYHTIEWSMKTDEFFRIYIRIITEDGFKLLYYEPTDNDFLGAEAYIHHGLGSDAIDGRWHTFKRNLQEDLKDAFAGLNVLSISWMVVRGNAKIDDVKFIDE